MLSIDCLFELYHRAKLEMENGHKGIMEDLIPCCAVDFVCRTRKSQPENNMRKTTRDKLYDRNESYMKIIDWYIKNVI